jgi:hypothetical protein
MSDSVDRYLEALFGGARPATLIEMRWRVPQGMARRFVAVADRRSLSAALVQRGSLTDAYVGVLPRWRASGGRADVVGDGRTVWVDLDTEVAARALEPVDPPPSLMVASGGPGHLHAYWRLTAGVPPLVIERANRRLAWALGADMVSTDAARILRPPQTVNHGRGGAPVRLLGDVGEPVRIGELIGGLLDPPLSRPPRARARRPSRDRLLAIEPERYLAALTGLRVGRSRKVRCPLHEDRTASLHVYEDPADGWYCFGCGQGGSVFDLAGALWGIEPRGSGFAAIRAGLEHRFGIR